MDKQRIPFTVKAQVDSVLEILAIDEQHAMDQARDYLVSQGLNVHSVEALPVWSVDMEEGFER